MRISVVQQELASPWGEIRDLYHQLLRRLYKKPDPRNARLLANRLEPLLAVADPAKEAIFGEECRSLICEARGDLRKAIKHRKNEIGLIRQLQAMSCGKPYEQNALEGYGYEDLADRLNLLAALYHDNGNLRLAIKTLEESRRLCADKGLKFDAADTLQEYIAESRKRQRQLKEL